MKYKIFLLTGCVFFCNAIFSQVSTSNEVRKFIDTTLRYPINHKYFILDLNIRSPFELIKKIDRIALRKISSSLFIVSKDVISFISPGENKFLSFIPANDLWKLSSQANKIAAKTSEGIYRFQILVEDENLAQKFQKANPDYKKKVTFLPGAKIISLATNYSTIKKYFLNNDEVTSIDVTTAPKEELATPGYDLSENKVNVVHSHYPLINGRGQHVSIKEQYYDTTDIDMKGRYEPSPFADSHITNHANFMATIIAGAGNSIYYAKGAAWGAFISSSSFEQVLPDPDDYYLQKNITVQNHSYGTIIENSYGIGAAAFDKSANVNQQLLHVFSSGNVGTSTSETGNYTGVPGFANLTGNFKMAKNALVVGAVDSFGTVVPLSSRGPAYDGRIKPELVAFQKNGTSEAAAIVSGTALLLQQFYKEKYSGDLPSALAKAILVTSADDVGLPGVDFTSGFGNMNADKAMSIINSGNVLTGMVSNGTTGSFQISVPPGISQIKVTLAWNDTAALPQAPKALVNDLDLELKFPSTGESWKPWVLNSLPDITLLNSPAQRKRDSLNNLEQVTVEIPEPGNYQIDVHGFDVRTGSQQYYIAYSFDSSQFFKWQRLTDSDFAEGGKQTILRWQNSFTGQGEISYQFVSANEWIPVASADLSKNYLYWTARDTIAPALLRMKIGNEFYYSDTFLVTKLLNPKIGFNCVDSILLFWEKIKNIDNYQVYQLGRQYMEPLVAVKDTSVIVAKSLLQDKYFAVAPVLSGGRRAPKSYALNYELQAAGCYLNAFLANADGNVAHLTIVLGTLQNIASISFEKLTASGFITIYTITPNGQLQYDFDYSPLTPGITVFRAKIVLMNGAVIYSGKENVAYAAPGKHLVYPVPASRNTGITIFTPVPVGENFIITDATGRTLVRKELNSPFETIQTATLQKGIYFYRIIKEGRMVASGKLILL